MRKGATIYRKILSLIGISSLVFTGLFLSLFYYTQLQEKEVYAKGLSDFDNEVTAVLELENQTNMSNIIDMVHWDEFVKYLDDRNQQWFDENINSSVETYKSDYLGIYDLSGNFIGKSSTSKIASADIIPKGVFDQLAEKRIMHFYIKLAEGYAQVYGATVHSTQDIYTKNGKPYGFFFIVKLLDGEYLDSLGNINNSEITIYDNNAADPYSGVRATRKLEDYQGQPMATFEFKRPFDVSFATTKNILFILIGIYFLNVLLLLIYVRLWVHKPLKMITTLLSNGNIPDNESLSNIPSEFRYIRDMLNENASKTKLLEIAKAKAEESDRLKSSFLTNISHEIRTPMNAVTGFSNLLLTAEISDAERLEYARIINQSGLNLISIIDDLIEMSRIDTNQIAPNFSNVDINTLITEVYDTVKILIPEHRQLDFSIIPPERDVTGKVVIDEVKLKQILTNLITNAIKYTEKGFVTFGFDVRDDTNEIEFSITDSGIGIDKNQQSKIFDRFHRVENDYTIIAGGLGLGLAISKAYVGMLGGRIWVKSAENIGTKFSFTIPLRYSNDRGSQQPEYDRSEKYINETAITILVAEDDNINYLLMHKMLSSGPHVIIRAQNGQEAVDLCTGNQNIDLVLMDIKMPVMDGFEAFSIIKILRPSLTVIAQTAFSSSDDESKIRDAGFHGYISKPIKKEKLFQIIVDAIRSKSII